MNIYKAVEWLYDNDFEIVFKNIGKELWEDLRQEISLIVLEYDEEKIIELIHKGKPVFKFWIVRVCCNQLHSKNGKMFKQYNTLLPIENVNRLMSEIDLNQYDHNTIDQVQKLIDKLYWYDKEILKMYIESGSVRKVAQLTGIPHTSIFITIKNIQKCIKQSLDY
jgi:hypothetical protein